MTAKERVVVGGPERAPRCGPGRGGAEKENENENEND